MELQTINYDDKAIVKTMQETVARGTTPAEFALFVQYCKATGLNPFKKEIWCIKASQGLQIMTGINGFWAIANASDTFDGAEVGLINASGEWVKTVPDNSFIGAWCRVYRKDRRIPMEGEALLADYAKGFGLWKTAPRIMIKKVAESIALRKAFPQELKRLVHSGGNARRIRTEQTINRRCYTAEPK
jgi:phage recombination protein Bet